MHRQMLKFPVGLKEGSAEHDVPVGSIVRHVGMQDSNVCLWTETPVMTTVESCATEKRCFEIFGTGQPVPDQEGIRRSYIGTAQQGTDFVWHIFEKVVV